MCAHAQLTPSILLLSDDTSYRQAHSMVLLNGYGMIGANNVDLAFLKKNIYGGHIEDATLNKLASGSALLNRAGFAASVGLDFYNFSDTLFGRPNWGLRVGASSNYHASLTYSRDLFKAVYRGNAQFAGDTAQLGPFAGDYQAWQKFSFGLFNKKSLTSVSLSLIAGESFSSLIMQGARLQTTTLGDTVSLSYTGDYLRSDTLKSGWANGSGLGACFDADYNLPIADNQGFISIALRDVGFVVWNKQSEQFTFDSLTTWTGVDADNIFDLTTDTLDLPNLRDSLNYDVRKKSFIAPLPMSLHVRFSKFFTTTDYYELGVSIWPNRAAIPLVYVGMSHFIGKNFIFSEKVSFGGYGTWGIGAEMQWRPCGSWILKAGTNHLGGFTMGSAHSRDVSFCVGKVISKASSVPHTMED